jgi:ketosteroid isomerase-like protein
VTVRVELTVRPTGRPLVDEEIHFWVFDDSGKVSAMRHYADTGAHIAAGVREAAVA